jgi:hypothetical protein
MQTDETTADPAGVTALAEQRGLGAAAGRRHDGSAARSVTLSLSVAAAAFAGSFALFYLAGTWFRPVVALAVLSLAIGVCGLGRAIVLPIRGTQSVHLYDNGLVHVRNGRPRAARWSEIERLEVHVVRDGDLTAGKVAAYLLKPAGQPAVRIPPNPREQPGGARHDPLGSTLVRLVSDAGRPVVQKLIDEKQLSPTRRPDRPPGDRTPRRIPCPPPTSPSRSSPRSSPAAPPSST